MLFYFISYFSEYFEPTSMLSDFEWHRAIDKIKIHNHKTQKLNTEIECLHSEYIQANSLTSLMNINIPEATIISTHRERVQLS